MSRGPSRPSTPKLSPRPPSSSNSTRCNVGVTPRDRPQDKTLGAEAALLQPLHRLAEFPDLLGKQVQVSVSLRLIAFVLPETLENGEQFLFLGDGKSVGRCRSLFLGYPTERVIEGVELIVEIIQRLIIPLAAAGGLGTRLQHSREVQDRLHPIRPLGFLQVLIGSWPEQVTTSRQADQQHGCCERARE